MGDDIKKVGPYELVEEIGRGAMGVVYRARHELTRREVALKVIFENVATSSSGAERFRREVSVSSLVDDDGIVEVYDAGEFEGQLFYAMELLEGRDLDELLGELSVGEVVDIVIDVMETVARCHTAGIVHRDLKPENIYVRDTPDGRLVKVLDFGIASIQASPTATQTGYALGTPSYMSPEQAMAPKTAGPPSDIWSAGVILYQACAGELPFVDEAPAAVMIKVVKQAHPALPEHTPSQLAEIIERCLEKKAEDRFRDATELVAALRAYRSSSGVTHTAQSKRDAFRPSTAEPPVLAADASGDSSRSIYPVVAGIAAVSLIVGLGLAFVDRPDDGASEATGSTRVAASPETVSARAEEPQVRAEPSVAVEEAAANVAESLKKGVTTAEAEEITSAKSPEPTPAPEERAEREKTARSPTGPDSKPEPRRRPEAKPAVATEKASQASAETDTITPEKDSSEKPEIPSLELTSTSGKTEKTSKTPTKQEAEPEPAAKTPGKAKPDTKSKPRKAEEEPEFFSF